LTYFAEICEKYKLNSTINHKAAHTPYEIALAPPIQQIFAKPSIFVPIFSSLVAVAIFTILCLLVLWLLKQRKEKFKVIRGQSLQNYHICNHFNF